GLGANQALGRPFTELARGADTLITLFERARTGGEGVVQRELAWPAPGGVDRILDCAVTQITIGHAQQLLLEIEDITQHRRLTRENALLAQLGGSRLMVRQLAHEIKNPLGGVRGAAQLLERELLDPALREYTRVIISEADRLTNLLDSMLGPGRPPAKQLVNVHELLERVYHLLRSEAPEGVIVDRDYDPSLPALTVDPNHIIQAMLNLGRNAIQALSGRGIEAPRLVLRTRAASNVSVGARRHRLVASIQFEDNGPGVLAEIRDTIFYPLVSGRSDGTGLGLGIAQDLVSRHGGLIEFDSAPGRTIFVISLPMDSV
ncbi:MAG: two-component system, NtrC family, nitrogen regulation sensor histidine kinase GlnL, partial [Gammaproteobacteria bacterium]|nr:two-component system, NtrC family, nitrogen regulation sensor histidine kinase GlnL [Gammaproteobacteria bacterium]